MKFKIMTIDFHHFMIILFILYFIINMYYTIENENTVTQFNI